MHGLSIRDILSSWAIASTQISLEVALASALYSALVLEHHIKALMVGHQQDRHGQQVCRPVLHMVHLARNITACAHTTRLQVLTCSPPFVVGSSYFVLFFHPISSYFWYFRLLMCLTYNFLCCVLPPSIKEQMFLTSYVSHLVFLTAYISKASLDGRRE
jgi:hypothetical protein